MRVARSIPNAIIPEDLLRTILLRANNIASNSIALFPTRSTVVYLNRGKSEVRSHVEMAASQLRCMLWVHPIEHSSEAALTVALHEAEKLHPSLIIAEWYGRGELLAAARTCKTPVIDTSLVTRDIIPRLKSAHEELLHVDACKLAWVTLITMRPQLVFPLN